MSGRGVAADGGGGVEARVEALAELVEVQERLADRGEHRRQRDPLLAADPGNRQHRLADAEAVDAVFVLGEHEAGDLALEGLLVAALPRGADLQRHVGDLLAAAVDDAQHQLQQPLAHARVDAADHAQVEQDEAVLLVEQHVAGVRVAVEEALDEDVLEVALEDGLGEVGAVDGGAALELGSRHRHARLDRPGPRGGLGPHPVGPARAARAAADRRSPPSRRR